MPAALRVAFLTAEASVDTGTGTLVQRRLLRIEQGDRRFELRPPESAGSVAVDLAPGLLHATLAAGSRATLEVDWIVHGDAALALDAWALATAADSEATIVDGLGRAVIGDLRARDPSMPPVLLAPGIYLLRAVARSGPLAIRIGQSIAANAIRAAV